MHQAGSTCREQKILQQVCSEVLSVGHEMAWGGMAEWVEHSASHTTELGGGGEQEETWVGHRVEGCSGMEPSSTGRRKPGENPSHFRTLKPGWGIM